MSLSAPLVDQFEAGDFVHSLRRRHDGPGKVLSISGDVAEIEYFDSVMDRIEASVPVRTLRHVELETGQRCYVNTNGSWRAGRITGRAEHVSGYFMDLAGTRTAVPERDIFVRWHHPISDAAGVLAAGGQGPYSSYQSRRAFADSVVRQRAASQGVEAFLSSAVELHRHQLEVANRVLTDPVRRYVLADEVGLGKTIEAGFVIRQSLLEDSELEATVAVPVLLIDQWRSELNTKFFAADFGLDRLRVISHEQLLDEGARAGLLVIDEAHRPIDGWGNGADTAHQGRYERLAKVAAEAKALLLLSATPLLHNEATFLAMLHLVDPENHRLADLEAFRLRVQRRQSLARSYRGLSPSADDFVLEELADGFRKEFPDDRRLGSLLDELVGHASEGLLSTALRTAIIATRIHLSETYRLHQRVLRTRRASVSAASFPVRGRRRPIPIEDEDPRRRVVDAWLRDWLAVMAEEVDLGRLDEQPFRELAFDVLGAVGGDLAYLGTLAAQRLEATQSREEAASWRELRDFLADNKPDTDRTDAIVGILTSLPGEQKAVVFTSRSAAARSIAERLRAELGRLAVAWHLEDDPPTEILRNVERFRCEPNCRVLVCDQSAEEGRNLQFADVVIHHDLPWSPNRLEQRLGRVDRYGDGGPVISYVLVSPRGEETIEDLWLRCLTDGLGLFDSSLASLQHFAESVPSELLAFFQKSAIPEFTAWVDTLRVRVTDERDAVRDLDELEATEVSDLSAVVEDLALLDADWVSIQQGLEAILLDGNGSEGGLGLQLHIRDDPAVRRYLPRRSRSGRPQMVPGITPSEYTELLAPNLAYWGTCRRDLAVHDPDLRLRRLGEPLVDALRTFTSRDDRGRVFAVWQRDLRRKTPLLAFRFDFLLEADITHVHLCLEKDVQTHWEGRSLQRRADMCLPPFGTTVWVDHNGAALQRRLVDLVERPFIADTAQDIYGTSELAEILPGWEERCGLLENMARVLLVGSVDFLERLRKAETIANDQVGVELERRRLRFDLGPSPTAETELARETALFQAFRRGVSEPKVTVDAAGVVILSQSAPGNR